MKRSGDEELLCDVRVCEVSLQDRSVDAEVEPDVAPEREVGVGLCVAWREV